MAQDGRPEARSPVTCTVRGRISPTVAARGGIAGVITPRNGA